MDEGKRGAAAPRQGSGRGLAYWTDGKGDERIVTVTPGYHLVQLNAKTGVPVASFGRNGVVDLKTEIDQPSIDLETADIGLNSPPALGNNVIVVGAAHLPGGAPRAKENVKGYIRGYDVRTGKRLWIFHTIPQPGEFGNDTWENDSWSYTGNAGNWAPITIDEELNRVYLATEDGTGDYFGGHRPGNNLFSASVVCLDLNTGKRLWYFQAIHHDIWDWDFPAPPILMDITVNGKPDQGRRRTVEAGVSLHVRSRDRPAGMADRRAARAARQSADRMVFADAAVSDEAGRATTGRASAKSDVQRLDAGDQGRSAARAEPPQVQRQPVRAADRSRAGWQVRHAHDAGQQRRYELGRGRLRSRDEDRLHLLVDRVQPPLAHQRSRTFEHELHRRRRRRCDGGAGRGEGGAEARALRRRSCRGRLEPARRLVDAGVRVELQTRAPP